MLEIKIQIQQILHKKEEVFYFPEHFSELSIEQWSAYYMYLLEEIDKGTLLWRFLKGNDKFKAKIPGDRIADIEHLLMFIYSEPAPEWYMNTITVDDTVLLGPKAEFQNLVCGEFAFADTYYSAYFNTKDEAYIDKCLAVLMREQDPEANENRIDWKGDHRIIFNENHIERRAALIAKVPAELKMAAMFNYSIIREKIEKRFIWIFQKSANTESKNSSGWDKVMRGMCQGDLTKLDQIFYIPLYTFFDELNDTIKANSK